MKLKGTLTAIFLCAYLGVAQNSGINYKALIKDTNGNVIANDIIVVQFSILETSNVGPTIYQETHSPSTDANGIVMINIGEGSPLIGTFSTIDWGNDAHFLKVQIDTGSGLTDMGTTEFKTVPYALNAANVNGLEALDEGNGIGWRLIGKDPQYYGNIGLNAVDLSESDLTLIPFGALGNNATAMGYITVASGQYATAFGGGSTASGRSSTALGANTTASGDDSLAMGSGSQASGLGSTAMGGTTIASGDFSTSMGIGTTAPSFVELVLGSHNTDYTPTSETTWEPNDRLFVIGNGTFAFDRSDALTVLKNGNLGVGTSTPDYKLSIEGEANLNEDIASGVAMRVNGDEALWYNGTYFSWGFGGTANFFDDNVGIGTPTPVTELQIVSSTDASLITPGYIVFGHINDQNITIDSNEIMSRNNGGTSILYLQNEGGAVYVGGVLAHSSDRRLKKDISDLSYGLNEILRLQPKSYYWKNRKQENRSFGLIAQDVQNVVNELVMTSEDTDMLSVNYTELIPILINAIQEQQEVILTLENKVVNHEAFITEILERVKTLENKDN